MVSQYCNLSAGSIPQSPILVTGASGIVGRAVTAAIDCAGGKVLRVVRTDDGAADPTIALDLAKGAHSLADVLNIAPAAVVHLAAAVPHGAPDTKETADLTRRIDANVANAVRRWNCPSIFMSTCGLYDPQSPGLKHEHVSPTTARSPYFAAKLQGEQLFGELGAVILRLAAPVGPPLKSKLVLSRFLSAAQEGASLNVWGSGGREQSFVDARDVANAILRILARPIGGIFNIAGPPITMISLAQLVVEVVGRGQVRLSGKDDPAEGQKARYDISAIREAYDWRPTTPLRKSLEWVMNSPMGE